MYPLIEFHLTGFCAYEKPKEGYGQCTLSGYSHPDSFLQDKALKRDDFEGAWVLDKRKTLEKNPMTCINGPMLDLRLGQGEVKRCPEPNDMLMVGLEGSFKTLALMKKTQPMWGGLDTVGMEDYIRYWAKCGARLGWIIGWKFVWKYEFENPMLPGMEV